MTDALEQVLRYVLIPVTAVILGGVVASLRPPGPRARSMIQHFAAGIVFAAVAGELLPEVMSEHAIAAVAIGFSLGIGVMLAIRQLTEGEESTGTSDVQSARGLMIIVGVDIIVDGLLIGIGFAAGAQQGLLLLLALTLEALFLGLAAALGLIAMNASRSRVIATTSGLGVLLAIAAVAGAAVSGSLSGSLLAGVLAFGSAALLYLVTEELLVEAHEVRETPVSTAVFFAGFLALIVVEML